MHKSICVVGAGMSGLAAVRGLLDAGHEVSCFEAGPEIGGTWRYQNATGRSAAYSSLHTNISRRNMRYASMRMDGSETRRLHHAELLAYLERYAQRNRLAEHITFNTPITSAEQDEERGWVVSADDGTLQRFDVLVAATGFLWDPNVPRIDGEFTGQTLHVRDYRTPESFAGERVLVIGAGQSALDVASEVSLTATSTVLSFRQGHHLMPPRVLGVPTDYLDIELLTRLPWPISRRLADALLVHSPAAPNRGGLPRPSFSMLEHRWPALVTANTKRALKQRTLNFKPPVSSFDGQQVRFADSSVQVVDAVIYGTGYHINFPFLPRHLGRGRVVDFPLYRRILSPHAENLAFIGIFDCGAGRGRVTEAQAQWLGALLAGEFTLPASQEMWKAIDGCGERRTRQRFASSGQHTVLCDRHAYLGVLAGDLGRRRWRLHTAT